MLAPAIVVALPAHERGEDVNESILKMILGLEGRMERIEASQKHINESKRLRGAIESGLLSL